MFGSVSSFSTVGMGAVWFKVNVVGLSASSATYRTHKEIAGYDVVVPYHASCHRCELAFKAAIGTEHAFLDLLAGTLQCAALFWNNAPSRLKRVVKGRRSRRRRRVRGRGASASGRSTIAGLSGSGREVSGHRATKATAVGQWSPRT